MFWVWQKKAEIAREIDSKFFLQKMTQDGALTVNMIAIT